MGVDIFDILTVNDFDDDAVNLKLFHFVQIVPN